MQSKFSYTVEPRLANAFDSEHFRYQQKILLKTCTGYWKKFGYLTATSPTRDGQASQTKHHSRLRHSYDQSFVIFICVHPYYLVILLLYFNNIILNHGSKEY